MHQLLMYSWIKVANFWPLKLFYINNFEAVTQVINFTDPEKMAGFSISLQSAAGQWLRVLEILIEGPSNLKAGAKTWSNYKHHNTIKFLTGITPSLFCPCMGPANK
jgi:hypothetical protein